MGQPYEHLTDAQIEHYGEAIAGAGPETEQQIEAHLADCPGCRARVLAFHRARFSPETRAQSAANSANSMTDSPSTVRRPDCPPENSLCSLAAGLTPPDQAASLIQHAAECARCGRILSIYTEDFADVPTSEDQSLLAQLKSSSPEWQKKLVRELQFSGSTAAPTAKSASGPARSISKPPWFRRLMVPVAAAACAAGAFFVWYQQRETPEKVEKLLAEAYTSNRKLEARLPGAAYAPMNEVRSAETGRDPSLSKAIGILRGRQVTLTSDPAWLQAKARAEVLESQPQRAIEALNEALKRQPDSDALKLDLSIAYFERGTVLHESRDYETALELLNAVLADDSTNRVALFNRALVNQKLGKDDQATQDWGALLRIEDDAGWAAEAQKRLAELKDNPNH